MTDFKEDCPGTKGYLTNTALRWTNSLLAIWDFTAAGSLLILPELFCIHLDQVWDAAFCCVKILFIAVKYRQVAAYI